MLEKVTEDPDLKHLLLICRATDFIDTSGPEMLESLSQNLYESGAVLHLAEVKNPVMDRLKHTDFYRQMHGEVFLTTHIAMKELANVQPWLRLGRIDFGVRCS